MLFAGIAEQSAGLMTATAGLIGAAIAAYKLLKPSPEAPPDVPDRPEDTHKYDHVSDVHDPTDMAMIGELRSALGESRKTVHALRRRLDQATGVDSADGE